MQFNISRNLKTRIYTSLGLILLFVLMLINNFVLGYVLLITGIFAILEFLNIIKLIFNKSKLKQILLNVFFISYIFSFCSIFLIFSNFIHLKILIFIILSICAASDIGGYIFGKVFKGAKLTKISPKKTISGALGSLILSSLLLSFVYFYFTKNFDFIILIVSISTSISCQLGDIFFSYLKRKSFLKDTGKFLPGHGGILDRIDGILLGLPVGFLTLLILN